MDVIFLSHCTVLIGLGIYLSDTSSHSRYWSGVGWFVLKLEITSSVYAAWCTDKSILDQNLGLKVLHYEKKASLNTSTISSSGIVSDHNNF